MSKEEIFKELNKIKQELENKNIGKERKKEIKEKLNILEKINKK